MILLAVDPGIRGCGVALFDEDRLLLTNAAYVENTCKAGNRANECADMAAHVISWGKSVRTGFPVDYINTIVLEWPRVYATRIRMGETKADPNDLLALAGVDAAIAAHMHLGAISYAPSEWKGQVPKDVMGKRILARLTDEERALVMAVKPASKRHNTIDAVGLGLHHLGRL